MVKTQSRKKSRIALTGAGRSGKSRMAKKQDAKAANVKEGLAWMIAHSNRERVSLLGRISRGDGMSPQDLDIINSLAASIAVEHLVLSQLAHDARDLRR